MMAPVSGSMGNPKSLIADRYTSKAAGTLVLEIFLARAFHKLPIIALDLQQPCSQQLARCKYHRNMVIYRFAGGGSVE